MGRRLLIWIAGLVAAGLFAATGYHLVDDNTRTDKELQRESIGKMASYVPYCDHKRMSPGDVCLGGDNGGSYQDRRTTYNATVTPEKLGQRYRTWRIVGYVLAGAGGLLVLCLLTHMIVTAIRGVPVRRPVVPGALPPTSDGFGARPGWSAPPTSVPAPSAPVSGMTARTGRGVAALAAVVTVGLLGGTGAWAASHGAPGARPEPERWATGHCLRQVSGPTTTPAPEPSTDDTARTGSNTTSVLTARLDAEKKRAFTVTGCDDPSVEGTITALVPVPDGKDFLAAQSCPVTTDDIHWAPPTDELTTLACVRRATGPHPGDPGGGNDIPAAGDCVTVGGTDSSLVRNDRVAEVPCAGKGWFAKILEIAPTDRGCPAATVSRVAHPITDTVLCLGTDPHGAMAKAGECFDDPQYAYDAPPRVDCDTTEDYVIAYRIDSFVAPDTTCPSGRPSRRITGYDRAICGDY